ncbi:MAG TPA: biopolymer transporter Tol [Microlunatus sp.]|nr:biopolymer transporter Tol [Microlunatus sp.]
MSHRTLAPGQRSQVWIGGPGLADPELLLETDELLVEAPNWSSDGTALFLNGNGVLWRLDVTADSSKSRLIEIAHEGLPPINNDHVLDPDGTHIYLSAADGHIYRAALAGGPVDQVTVDEGVWHFLHGVSPDGRRLAYVRLADFSEPGRLAIMEPHGPTTLVDTGVGHIDGPEWSPDGAWIHLNTEAFTDAPGHAQLARVADDGTAGGDVEVERLVVSDTVDWFPHLSSDGQLASYITFPAGTLGHPADLDVEVRVVDTSDWSTPLQWYPLFGGQGTINVNSWAPDSTRFAFVAYPID